MTKENINIGCSFKPESIPQNQDKTIISLFDYTGNWSAPYVLAGYNVYQFDIKNGIDISEFSCEYLLENWNIYNVQGIMAAPPCTEFSSSGARWWKRKDSNGITDLSVELVHQILKTVELFSPKWWVIENPVGRLNKLVPEIGKPQYFQPCDYGDPYTKKTGLFGNYVFPTPLILGTDWAVDPSMGSKMHTMYGGKSEKTKTARSETPKGFANAFFLANQ